MLSVNSINRIPVFLLGACLFCNQCGNTVKNQPDTGKRQLVPEEATQLVSFMSENSKVKAK
jgi:hypothetical protein